MKVICGLSNLSLNANLPSKELDALNKDVTLAHQLMSDWTKGTRFERINHQQSAASIALMLRNVLSVEGAFVDHEADPGGATQFGVTEEVSKLHGFKNVRELTLTDAKTIWLQDYFKSCGAVEILCIRAMHDEDERLSGSAFRCAEELFEAKVNLGNYGTIILQRVVNALNHTGGKTHPDLREDGSYGPATKYLLSVVLESTGPSLCSRSHLCRILDIIRVGCNAGQGSRYAKIASKNSKLRVFYKGWMERRVA